MNKKCFFLTGPERNTKEGYWLRDFLVEDGYSLKSFYLRKSCGENLYRLKYYYRITKALFCVLFKANKNDLILTYDQDTFGLYVALGMRFLRPDLVMHKINCMGGQDKDHLYYGLKKILVREAYKNTFTSVNNEKIGLLFSKFLDIPESHFVPIPDSISDFGEDILKISDRSSKGYIFSGGATYRDYTTLIKCAEILKKYNFVVVTTEVYQNDFLNAPENVRVIYKLPEREFYEMIAHSELVFVPLSGNVQGGQMVLFQGALLEKPLVTTENEAIHTYFDKNSIIIIKKGDYQTAAKEIAHLMQNVDRRKMMGINACTDISNFTTTSVYKQYKDLLFNKTLTD